MIKQMGFLNDRKVIDRRGKPRFKIKANCSYHPADSSLYSDDFNICKIQDISLDGMSFLSENGYSLDKRLFFIIAIHDSITDEPINAFGDVVWVSQYNVQPFRFKIGVRFSKILQDDLMNLSHCFINDNIFDLESDSLNEF